MPVSFGIVWRFSTFTEYIFVFVTLVQTQGVQAVFMIEDVKRNY